MPPHPSGRPRCTPCTERRNTRCDRKLPECGSCAKYSRHCVYPGLHDEPVRGPSLPSRKSTPNTAERREGSAPRDQGSNARDPTPGPAREPSQAADQEPAPDVEQNPAPAAGRGQAPTAGQHGVRRTHSLSSILGDRADPTGRKRDVRSPSPTLGEEIAARSERIRQLRAQLDTETAEIVQLTAIADAAPGAQNQGGRPPNHPLNINPLGDPIIPPNLISAQASSLADLYDGIIPGFQASGVTLAIPDSVVQNMRRGWKTPFSIAMLRDEYCIAAISRARKGKTISFGDEGDHVTLAASSETFDSSLPEDCLTYEQWVQAWRRLLALIREYLSEVLHLRWLKHYEFIDTCPNRSSHWKLWLRYDIAVRVATRSDPRIDPATFQQQIYADLTTQFAIDSISAIASTSQGTSSTPKPGNRLTRPPSTATSSRQPRTPGTSGICFRCGRDSHTALTCTETKQASGRDILIQHTTEQAAHAQPPHVNTAPTSAPYADPTNTVPRLAPNDPRKVVTPLIPDAWESTLRQHNLWHRFYDIPDGLRYGFRIGTSRLLSTSSMPPNHKSALDNPTIIEDTIRKEISAGRYSGPFSPQSLESLIGPFQSAPLGVVEKSKPGEFRIVQDFSFPRDGGTHPALNAEINSDDFTCEWGFFGDIADILLACPPGTEAATLDVDAAYRRMPVHPSDQPHTVVIWNGKAWLDHCVPFGASSSNGIFGRCGDAMAHIAEALGLGPVRKWVDDFVFFRSPPPTPDSSPRFSLEDIYALAATLGWPWKDTKTTPFGPSFTYLGLEWHIPTRTVSITQPKRDKYIGRAREWLSSGKVTLNQTETLLGSLSHCTQVITDGRPHLAGLIAFCTQFTSARGARFQTRTAPPRALEEVGWWLDRLSAPCTRTLRPPHPHLEYELFMDASTSFGIGLIIDGHVAAWKLVGAWRRPGVDIGWAEMAAVELALSAIIGRGVSNRTVSFRSDNKGVVFATQAGRSRNQHQNAILMRILEAADTHGIDIEISYIRSAENPADSPSRGLLSPDTPPINWEFHVHPDLIPVLARITSCT
ncbi:hypothetical protein RSOLAG22IIIB_07569 [Rhizoctonia solani]|uniref:Zn(2)-C6 fungal-type domain-containing protein n=1 Tax=Rhizoctonia solani TaxID=456999 RepID=A0A0K6FNU2_9AGAM|nr:hypothetical protein RSOLAG22IIIB_07569 [Rhizoctonia solani]